MPIIDKRKLFDSILTNIYLQRAELLETNPSSVTFYIYNVREFKIKFSLIKNNLRFKVIYTNENFRPKSSMELINNEEVEMHKCMLKAIRSRVGRVMQDEYNKLIEITLDGNLKQYPNNEQAAEKIANIIFAYTTVARDWTIDCARTATLHLQDISNLIGSSIIYDYFPRLK